VATHAPFAVPVPEAIRMSGIGRTKLYEAISAGRIDARKHGRRTLVIVRSLEDYLSALPRLERDATVCAGSTNKPAAEATRQPCVTLKSRGKSILHPRKRHTTSDAGE